MKRAVIVVIILGMVGWVVYDFVLDVGAKNETTENLAQDEGLESGMLAPDFKLETLAGEEVNLSDFRGEKVLLNFWATWCPPCRAEMPDMQKFYENDEAVILAVNLLTSESDPENVPEFVDEFGVTFPILMDEHDAVSSLYAIQPIPTSYLINSDGTVHNMIIGALNYDRMVQEFGKMN